MEFSYIPPYGHGLCPHCREMFDIAESDVTFFESTHLADDLAYILCPVCARQYYSGDSSEQRRIENRCFINIKRNGKDKEGKLLPWAYSTRLTLSVHGNDPVAAIEYGLDIPALQYFLIVSGSAKGDQNERQ